MKRTYIHILFALALLAMVSCTREQVPENDGAVRFMVTAAQGDEPESRTSYGSRSGSLQNILWTAGDRIVIWSPDAVNETSGLFTHPALSYTINGQASGSSSGQATGITPVTSGSRFQWGEAPTHVFYGKYPDPAWSAAAPHSHTAFASQDPKSSSFQCYLPASTTVTPSSGTYTYTQDMRWCYMTAYASVSRLSTVNLDFIPAVSTFKFTVSNSSAGALSVSKVKLSSASHRLNGDYSVGISSTPSFSVPENSLAAADKSVALQFSSSLSVPSGSSLTVTLFTCPVTANDLTLTLTTASGDMSLDLKNSGGTWFSYPAGNYCNVTCTAIESNELSSSIILVSTSGQTNTNVTAASAWSNEFPFTVNAQGKKVIIAPGNLMAKIGSLSSPTATASEWKFGEPTEYVGASETGGNYLFANGSQDCVGKWVDLFEWQGASCTNDSAHRVHGLLRNTFVGDAYLGNVGNESPYNGCWDGLPISNGGMYYWQRPLTSAEWTYLLNTRSDYYRFALATVKGVYGLIIFPDGFILPPGITIPYPNMNTSISNTLSDENWSKLMAFGCVFLPATGSRYGSGIVTAGSEGNYWTSTAAGSDYTFFVYDLVFAHNVRPDGWDYNSSRDVGKAVRLVRYL